MATCWSTELRSRTPSCSPNPGSSPLDTLCLAFPQTTASSRAFAKRGTRAISSVPVKPMSRSVSLGTVLISPAIQLAGVSVAPTLSSRGPTRGPRRASHLLTLGGKAEGSAVFLDLQFVLVPEAFRKVCARPFCGARLQSGILLAHIADTTDCYRRRFYRSSGSNARL